jgi:DNA-binding transcriptional LysR family regulator
LIGLRGSKALAPRSREDLHFDTVSLATDAAASGMGIAIGRAPLISPDLTAGRLVKADTRVIDIETGYWLVGPDGQETRPAIRSFRRWVLEEAKEYCAQNGLR